MSVFAKWNQAMNDRDADAVIDCLHDDYRFVRHQSGTSMDKNQMSEMMRGFMASDQVVIKERRCLYENSEILVEHSVMDFADGTRECIISFNRLQDGKIIYSETGATPVDKN